MFKIVKPEDGLMDPVTGTIRESLHAALDDLMNDIEKRTETSVGGMMELHADEGKYRHRITIAVSIVTEPLSDPSLN